MNKTKKKERKAINKIHNQSMKIREENNGQRNLIASIKQNQWEI